MTHRIIGLGGTSAARSSSMFALRAVLDAASAEGAEVELLELGRLGLPMYEHGIPAPPSVERYLATMDSAHALVWSSPLYHGTVSGLFKNAIDWLELLSERDPAYLHDKPVGLVAVAAGGHALQAVTAMEHMVRSLRGWTVPYVVAINHAAEAFDRDGTITSPRVDTQLKKLGSEVVRAASVFRPR